VGARSGRAEAGPSLDAAVPGTDSGTGHPRCFAAVNSLAARGRSGAEDRLCGGLHLGHVTSKVAESDAESPPSWQVTLAVEVPGFVLVPTFHVHETLPAASARG
jgi:hypothetical protein